MGTDIKEQPITSCQDFSFDPHLQGLCQEIDQANRENKPKVVSQKLKEAFDYLVEKTPDLKTHYLEETKGDQALARRRATENLGLVGDAFQDAIGTPEKGKDKKGKLTDPLLVLKNYLEGQAYRLAGGCEPITGQETFRDLDQASKGDYGCPVIAGKDERAIGLLNVYQAALDRRWSLKAFFQQLKEYGVRLQGGLLTDYEVNKDRTYAGAGGFASLTIPFKEKSPFVVGAEVQAVARWGFDDPNIAEGELKSFRLAVFPILFQTGYRRNGTSILLQAGGWFSGYKLYDGEQEIQPYSQEDPFANGHLRIGLRAYLFKDHLALGGGYQRSPWGDSGYFNLGVQF